MEEMPHTLGIERVSPRIRWGHWEMVGSWETGMQCWQSRGGVGLGGKFPNV